MPRIPFVSADADTPEDVVAAMRARRGGRLNEADRIVLHAPEFARGFNLLMGAVRHKLVFPAFLRELAICGVGYLNGSDFEVVNHIPELRTHGATEEQIVALEDFVAAAENNILFDRKARAVMRLTIEMTNNVKVSDSVFAEVAALFPEARDIVELVGIISSYNMASRLLMALEID